MLYCGAKKFSAGEKKKKQKVDRVHNYNNVVQTKKEKKRWNKKRNTNADHADYIGLYSYIGIVNLGNGDLTYVPANYASGARCVFK